MHSCQEILLNGENEYENMTVFKSISFNQNKTFKNKIDKIFR